MKIITKLLLLSILALTGCTQTNTEKVEVPVEVERIIEVPTTQPKVGTENNANGTSDGGGGDIDYSTHEQIKAAVEKTRSLLTNDSFIQRFVQMFSLEIEQLNIDPAIIQRLKNKPSNKAGLLEIEISNRLDLMLNPWLSGITKKDLQSWGETEEEFGYAIDLFMDTKIFYEENGPCPANNSDHADASISKYTTEADICFSLKTLRRIPPDSLEAQIFGLWLHEGNHMMGEKDEDWAVLIEKSAAYIYPRLFRPHWQDHIMVFFDIATHTAKLLDEILMMDDNLSNQPKRRILKKRFYSSLGRARGTLEIFHRQLSFNSQLGILIDGANATNFQKTLKGAKRRLDLIENLQSLPEEEIFSENGKAEISKIIGNSTDYIFDVETLFKTYQIQLVGLDEIELD